MRSNKQSVDLRSARRRSAIAGCVPRLLCTFLLLLSLKARAFDALKERVIPQPDAYADLMLHAFPDIAPERCAAQQNYFSRPVPRIVHQVAKDAEEKKAIETSSPWPLYARQQGYTFRVWSLEDLELDLFSDVPTVREAVRLLRGHGRIDAGLQLFELAVLGHAGGILVSQSAQPPRLDGHFVDLARFIKMHGLSVATSLYARDIGHMSIYLTHAFMASPARHPWLEAMAPLAAKNAANLMEAGHTQLPARYLTGNAFLSRNLYGSFHVLLYTYLQSLGVFPKDTPEGSLDALD